MIIQVWKLCVCVDECFICMPDFFFFFFFFFFFLTALLVVSVAYKEWLRITYMSHSYFLYNVWAQSIKSTVKSSTMFMIQFDEINQSCGPQGTAAASWRTWSRLSWPNMVFCKRARLPFLLTWFLMISGSQELRKWYKDPVWELRGGMPLSLTSRSSHKIR